MLFLKKKKKENTNHFNYSIFFLNNKKTLEISCVITFIKIKKKTFSKTEHVHVLTSRDYIRN